MPPVEEVCYWLAGLAIRHFGEAEARRLALLGERNAAEMIGFLAREGTACDYDPTGGRGSWWAAEDPRSRQAGGRLAGGGGAVGWRCISARRSNH